MRRRIVLQCRDHKPTARSSRARGTSTSCLPALSGNIFADHQRCPRRHQRRSNCRPPAGRTRTDKRRKIDCRSSRKIARHPLSRRRAYLAAADPARGLGHVVWAGSRSSGRGPLCLGEIEPEALAIRRRQSRHADRVLTTVMIGPISDSDEATPSRLSDVPLRAAGCARASGHGAAQPISVISSRRPHVHQRVALRNQAWSELRALTQTEGAGSR